MLLQLMYNAGKMRKPREFWRSRGYGFVEMATIQDAVRCAAVAAGSDSGSGRYPVEVPAATTPACACIVSCVREHKEA
jgi:hypothetical protein